MKTSTIIILSVLGFLLLLGGCGCNGYNGLVKADEVINEKWGNVQSDYQRRADLIPNLIETVKGVKNFEQETLTKVVEARAKATAIQVDPSKLNAETIRQYQRTQGELSTALGKLLAITENYPALRATENFRDLQAQLEGTENRIKVARNDFNAAVKAYNAQARSFPTNILAKLFGFEVPKAYFEADAGAEKSPQVAF